MSLPEIIYRGSVKDIRGEKIGEGDYIFDYSDRYSVFDWGEMPDQLEGKGVALAYMADVLFKRLSDPKAWALWELPSFLESGIAERLKNSSTLYDLRKSGAAHHGKGLVDKNLQPVQGEAKTNLYRVGAVSVLHPKENKGEGKVIYDYSVYQERPTECLVPLEVVFRFGTPKGSSLLRRLKKNPDYLKELDQSQMPKEGAWLARPIVEFSTKLEPEDRYLTKKEAQTLAGMNDNEFEKLYDLNLLLALRLKDIFAELKLELWDGKFEFAFTGDSENDRSFKLVDSIGPDELRLMHKNVQLSKEVLRQFYTGSEWHLATRRAKDLASERGESNWKKLCIEELKQRPEPLSIDHKKLGESIYHSIANALAIHAGRPKIFAKATAMEDLMAHIQREI